MRPIRDFFQLKTIVLAAFFLSGASALIYEVVWMRMLVLSFGSTAFAVSSVLTGFMAGLALGSYAFGRIADRIEDRLRAYILLEAGIGVYGLLTPFLFGYFDALYVPFSDSLSQSFYLLNLLRFVFAFAIIFVGTALMGATLPVLSRYYVERVDEAGRRVGTLYGLNTLGAVLGVGLGGFFLIPYIGVKQTLYTAVALNAIAGGGLYLILRAYGVSGKESSSVAAKKTKKGKGKEDDTAAGEPLPRGSGRGWVILVFAVSGFTALAYEVVWTKFLALVIGSSTYAFTTMLATFLLGIAAGSFVMTRLLGKIRGREIFCFAAIEGAIAVSVLLVGVFAGKFPLLFFKAAEVVPYTFFGIQMVQFFIAFITMFLTTFLFGTLLPLVCALYAVDADRLGAEVGRIYAANTVGTILGAFLCGFVLVPVFGSETTLKALAWVNMALAAVLFLKFAEGGVGMRGRLLAAFAVPVIILTFAAPRWNPLLINSNLPNLLKLVAAKDISAFLEMINSSEVLYADEDAYGHVLVFKDRKGNMQIHANGTSEGGTHPTDMPVQVQLAVVPALMHPAPEKALIIGLGGGMTLGSIEKMDGVKKIDCVEISPGVVRAAGLFSAYNNNALEDPRLSIITDDARHYLDRTPNKYDIIINGPSYSWVSGTANLFTKEFLEIARDSLNPGGMVALWMHLYLMTPESIKSFIRTVDVVFPHATVWLSGSGGELIVVGSVEDLPLDYALLKKRLKMPSVVSEIERVMPATAKSFVELKMMDEKAVNLYSKDAPLNTDNDPVLEFFIPKHLYSWDMDKNFSSLAGEGRSASLALRNFSRAENSAEAYDHIGLRSGLKDWKASAYYISETRFDRKRVPRISRDSVPALVLNKGPYAFEAFGTGVIAAPDDERLEVLVKSSVKWAGTKVKRSAFDGGNLYWSLVKEKRMDTYFMAWYCNANSRQYFAKLKVSDPGGRRFGDVMRELDRGIDCFLPR